MAQLTAPFPYIGGKRQWAKEVWSRLGKIDVYSEPFAGSLAVLLANPHPAQREVVSDIDGHICNFWRAMAVDPAAVAYWADWPTLHHDLTARHKWLVQWAEESSEKLINDPEWYDAKAAGWWCWGISNWIGGGWCSGKSSFSGVPYVSAQSGSQGVSTRRVNTPFQDDSPAVSNKMGGKIHDKRPHIKGQGVQAQRVNVPFRDDSPAVSSKMGGKGVALSRLEIPVGDQTFDGQTGERLMTWFKALSNRLTRVVTLNRDWSSAVTNTMLQQVKSSPKGCVVGIFMDPPYRLDTGRSKSLYQSDVEGKCPAEDAFEWAIEHGDRYRIAYACHAGDFEIPDGWTAVGKRLRTARKGASDQVLFSPACLNPEEADSARLDL